MPACGTGTASHSRHEAAFGNTYGNKCVRPRKTIVRLSQEQV